MNASTQWVGALAFITSETNGGSSTGILRLAFFKRTNK